MKLMNLSGMSAYGIQLLLDNINNALTMGIIAHRSHDESRVHERQFATLTKRVQVEAHRQNLLRSTGTT